MTSPVIDLSHHNPTPDWDAIKRAGVVGVIHKATEGTSYVDDQLFKRGNAAMAAGLKWATYHFLRSTSWQAQMEHYLETIDPVPGERICLDHEPSSDGSKMSLGDLVKCVDYLRRARPDLRITIYSGHLIKEQLGSGRDAFLAENTDLWIAHYTSAAAPTWPKATWPQWRLWQWTDKEKIPGISQAVDGDRFNGSLEELRAWFGPAGSDVQPDPEPPPAVVPVVEMTVPAGVRLIVNGVEVGAA